MTCLVRLRKSSASNTKMSSAMIVLLFLFGWRGRRRPLTAGCTRRVIDDANLLHPSVIGKSACYAEY